MKINKFLSPLLLSLFVVSIAFAQDTKSNLFSDMQYFKDISCTELKKSVKNTDSFKSESLKALAQQLLDEEYCSKYLAAEYEAYPTPEVIGREYFLNDGFSKYENITGVYLEKGQHIIMVGDTKGKKIKLLLPELMRKPAEGIEPTKDPLGWGLLKEEIELNEGLNIVNVSKDANAYISYFDENFKSSPKIDVHFVTGKVNGYFDITKGDTNEDWNELLKNAVSPIMDARGKYIQVAYPVEWFNVYTKNKGVELINAYDNMLNAQYTLMGLVKYNKIPKNRVFARVNFNYYMFRDGDGVAYLGNEKTMGMVADPAVVSQGDPCWGFSHEAGHVMQMRPITWGGMTEVSNNIFSLYTLRAMGNKGPSRIKEINSYSKARESIIEKNISYLQDPDVFNRLVPFWQLQLYFEQNGNNDFYPDLMEYLRKNSKDLKGNETIQYMFDFIKASCDVTKTDLTDFFEKWGFFYVGDLELNDYAKYNFTITQQMVDDTKAYIASKKYKKPSVDITTVEEK